MSTVIDFPSRDNFDRPHLWHRFERADLREHSLDLQTQGVSQRQAAKQLQVPRTTLHAWPSWHDTLDLCPHVAQFFQSGPGLACLHRRVLALPLLCVEVGACGLRLVCLLRNLTGLDRFVAASYGAQQPGNVEVAHASVDSQQTDTSRLATARPRKGSTMTQDATCTGGLCLVASDPVSHCILLEQLAPSREHATWPALMAPALAQRNGAVMQSTRAAAPGIVASVAHQLGAHHSPDVLHVQHARSQAVCAPLATQERAANTALSAAKEALDHAHARLERTAEQLEKRGPGRPPTAPRRLEHAQHTLDAASREPARLAPQRAPVTQRLETIGQASPCVDLDRGGRRNGPLSAADSRAHLEMLRPMAPHEHLSQRSLDRIDNTERVVPTMQATMELVLRCL